MEISKNQIFDFGVALDGDGDRAIFVLPDGSILDGDEILFILTKHKKDFQSYNKPVVGTVMTNYGIRNDFNVFFQIAGSFNSKYKT